MKEIMGILLRRLVLVIPVVWAVVTLVFLLLHLVPGDPVLAFLGETATPEQVAEMRHRFGLDRPLLEQYVTYWMHVVRGDLGVTFVDRRPVAEKILSRYPATLQSAVAALLVAVTIAKKKEGCAAAHDRDGGRRMLDALLHDAGVSGDARSDGVQRRTGL